MSRRGDARRRVGAGIAHHQAGRLAEAETLYGEALALDPKNADALYLRGTIFVQTGRRDEGIQEISASLELKPDNPHALNNLGLALKEQGRLDEAIARYTQALRIKADFPDALNNLGLALKDQGRLDEAIARYGEALRVRPEHHQALNNLGMALKEQGRLGEAIARYTQALRVRPDYHQALNNLGLALQEQGKPDEAIARYTEALRVRPDYPEALNNLGNALQEQGRSDEAMARYTEALRVRPDYPDAHYNLGNVLKDQGRLDEAIARYRQALSLKPDYHLALNNIGMVLKEQGRLREAIEHYQQALRLKPDHWVAYSNMLFVLNYWPDIDDDGLLRVHRGFEAACTVPVERHWDNPPEPERPLRVGYVSPDFRRHPVGYFLEAVWAAHDRSRVTICAYSDVDKEDETTGRLRRLASEWRSVAGLRDADLAARIRADGIDILVDLAGHTGDNRLPVFARRPAPVQVSWIGYFHTTGLSAIDAILMDPVTVPPGHERWFVEEVIRLPQGRFCYQPPADAPAVAPPPCRASGRVTFGSFNNLSKVTGPVLALWARVLAAVPGSRLVLKWKTLLYAAERQRLRTAFAAAGGDPQRLELRGPTPHAAMLAEYADIDIALDPFPFTGATTTCEALLMGVPVVTWPGTRPVSRQSLAILTSLGLEADLAVDGADRYVEVAAALARAPDRLSALRSGLRPCMLASPLCDGPGFTGTLETVYRDLWRRWCVGIRKAGC